MLNKHQDFVLRLNYEALDAIKYNLNNLFDLVDAPPPDRN
jgi:hypothetical protein